ncbi:MAG: hypothetical protein Q8936_24620 [Bacillota bacterium]|nr:hypothetical protein [Bacillota bacterium]
MNNIGTVAITATESMIDFQSANLSLVNVKPTTDCQISVNNNGNYNNYTALETQNLPGPISALYVKTYGDTGNLQYWAFR